MATPVIVCLKSEYNNKYLQYRHEDIQTHGLLQFAADNVMDPYAQFEVENSKTYDGLVHLKCRYNNKYLVRWSPNHDLITASAIKIDENKNNWSCTLFEPSYVGDHENHKMRLLHVQLDHYACLWRTGTSFDSYLFTGSKEIDRDSCDVITFVNVESLYKIPKKVAFKDETGKYLGAFLKNGLAYLQSTYDNLKDPMVAHEAFTTVDGTLCIKSIHLGKFWRLGNNDWIYLDAQDPRGTSNVAAMFRHAVLDINRVALFNMSKTWFCKKFSHHGLVACLNAATQNVDRYSKFEVIDLGSVSSK